MNPFLGLPLVWLRAGSGRWCLEEDAGITCAHLRVSCTVGGAGCSPSVEAASNEESVEGSRCFRPDWQTAYGTVTTPVNNVTVFSNWCYDLGLLACLVLSVKPGVDFLSLVCLAELDWTRLSMFKGQKPEQTFWLATLNSELLKCVIHVCTWDTLCLVLLV